jgi:hypothetical protein
MEAENDGRVGEAIMGSPIFDATFQTGRFEKEKDMKTQKDGLVDQVQDTLKTFRASASVQGEPDFRELAVTIVRVFRDYIEAEILKPDSYDMEQPSKGQGWE